MTQHNAFKTYKPVKMNSNITLTLKTLLVLILCSWMFNAGTSHCTELRPVSVVVQNNKLHVETALNPEERFLEDLQQGISKEIIFYIDLFRIWKVWPNEFVRGLKIKRTIKSNPIKREYIATSQQEGVIIEKRFRDMESMIQWALGLNNIVLLNNLTDYQEGTYYVKVSAESIKQKLSPAVGILLFFISNREFSVSRDSTPFTFHNQ